MRALIAAAAVPLDVSAALASRGVEHVCVDPPRALVLAWRVARRAAGSSVPRKMAARAAFERGWGAYAASRVARDQPDLVVADLAVARALGDAQRPVEALVLVRGTAERLHAELDAEAARSPALAAHLTNFRASHHDRARERRLVGVAERVIALSSWIADSAVEAGARDVRVVPPALSDAVAPVSSIADGSDRVLRVLVAGALIGRHGARAMLDAARAMGRRLDVTFAGRIADDPSAIARWAGHFRIADAPSFEAALAQSDVLAAPWVIDGRAREVEVACSRGVPVVATRAAGVDAGSPGALSIDAGSTESLLSALESLRDPHTRASLAQGCARARTDRSAARTVERIAAALFDARDGSS